MSQVKLESREEGKLHVYKKPKRERWLELRNTCITSTEVGSAAGMSKYGMTRWSIYHTKRGTLPDQFKPNDRSEMGKFLENGIARFAAQKMGVRVLRLPDFMIRGSLGASFDYEIHKPDTALDGWLVECKNVDQWIFRDQWAADDHGNPIPPDHITCQIQAQLETARRPGCVLAAAVGGNDLKLIKIARDKAFGESLSSVASNLWADICIGKEPDPVAVDADNVPLVYSDVDDENTIDARNDATLSHKIASWYALKAKGEGVKAEQNELKAQILLEIVDARRVVCMDGYTLDAGFTKDGKDSVITQDMVGDVKKGRKGFRRFGVKQKN